MPILPLPQFEADLEADRKVYDALKPPTSIVVRFGAVKMIGEFAYDGDSKPGCGSKLVARTHRGTELCEMLTSTCPNAGCSKSVTRKEMLEYIENSGGRDYPYFSEGRILRIATVEDLNRQGAIDAEKHELVKFAREVGARLNLPMKIVDAEKILGGERLTYYFASEERIDFRPMVMELAARYHTRIEMRQVGARDEARLTADYEKCGQHCCCKQFLKVLKPVSMKNAKIQKATLDPLKISGRCGRLMCCLRYEESTYDDLRKRLPKKKTRTMTPDGPGLVIDTQILTQLVLVLLEGKDEQAAYPVESLEPLGPGGPPNRDDSDDEDDGPHGSSEGGPSAGPPPSSQPPRAPQGPRDGGGQRGPGGPPQGQPRRDDRRDDRRGDNRPNQPKSDRGGPPQNQPRRDDRRNDPRQDRGNDRGNNRGGGPQGDRRDQRPDSHPPNSGPQRTDDPGRQCPPPDAPPPSAPPDQSPPQDSDPPSQPS